MIHSLLNGGGVVAVVLVTPGIAWFARRLIRRLMRRAVRLAATRPGTWRARLQRLGELDPESDARKRQRADATARMLGHVVSGVLYLIGAIFVLHLLGVDPVYAISSAGFVGLAIALSGQELIRNLLAGMLVLLEDRYAVGDDVILRAGGTDVRGVVDLMGAASVRLRTEDGATWHAGHGTIEGVTNYSQLPAATSFDVDTATWLDVQDGAAERVVASSNDVGLTGVVFLPELARSDDDHGRTTLTVKSNRQLTASQADEIRRRLCSPS